MTPPPCSIATHLTIPKTRLLGARAVGELPRLASDDRFPVAEKGEIALLILWTNVPHYSVNPTDGALFSDGFSLGPPHEKAWESELQRVQRIRGEVLSAIFEVESSIDYAIADCVLPRTTIRSRGSLWNRHILFQNEVLSHFDLRNKIDILKSLLSHRFPRREKQTVKLISLMNMIREVRNRMAHSPVYFEALEKPVSGRWLRPVL